MAKRDREAHRGQRLAAQAALERAEHRRHVRNIALSAVVLSASRTGSTLAGANATQTQRGLALGETAPPFRVHDVVSGRDVTLGTTY
jgi:hypothetical protein